MELLIIKSTNCASKKELNLQTIMAAPVGFSDIVFGSFSSQHSGISKDFPARWLFSKRKSTVLFLLVELERCTVVLMSGGLIDCIDCAADAAFVSVVNDGIESVVSVVNDGIKLARDIVGLRRPWVMISVNYDKDLHFRKAGVVSYVRDTTATADLIERNGIDAVEMHTSGRQTALFEELWDGLGDSIAYLTNMCVSLANVGDSTLSSMNTMYSIVEPNLPCFNLWQFMK
ncbi:hypothetical protein CMV_021176 [Castanea mollissima]|uniref:Iron-sulphur binding protein LdpA C-terminal domain-containing protein n=1 Tax=Castanea mollissima TaxID=60419 RepID=A0A8J4QKD3_9ROSI|nr:hypothetical protein CMV_021176 [Castanea mollissima]